ncbi:lipopolysaccharide-induced tumor necrosis factor-alpha factor homolog isoform X2 [Gambusia affinis]|uniref:lipopolysaccharide-induced tumor necrosis factor-alpha factor homolog isoform X2 n=1 Tax=Gambusia affinis TaxID=33528 RepID=UPI001CDB7B21|nr:lipopolysaccharide-induced tumor necrosis factor-alpha factor homolog isoform X2 [Gambusia affinis]
MEKGEGPPPDIADIAAPPYPGPPLDSSVVINQPTPVYQPVNQPHAQQYQQPVDQQYPQPHAQQYQQPVAQQYPQPVAQQYQQPVAQTDIQLVQMQVGQQNQTAQPVNPVVVVQARPTEAPGSMLCPHCRTTVVSTIEYKLGMLTWIIVGSLFIIGCWPCCLIPFCVSGCKDVQHSCPQCNNVLHVHRRM